MKIQIDNGDVALDNHFRNDLALQLPIKIKKFSVDLGLKIGFLLLFSKQDLIQQLKANSFKQYLHRVQCLLARSIEDMVAAAGAGCGNYYFISQL